MKVASYYNNNDIRIEERDIPKIDSGEILMKVIASGICGSDVMEWYRVKSAPRVLGHEVTGIVEKVGKNVKKFKVGERIFATHHVPCNECIYCSQGKHTVCETLRTTNFDPGGFSQYIRIPKINVENGGVHILPKEISFEEGTFIEPLACVVRGQNLVDMQRCEDVLVIGSGISGLLHIQLAKNFYKVKKVFAIDINDFRLRMAKKIARADFVVNSISEKKLKEKLLELNGKKLFDRVLICTSAIKAIEQSFDFVDKGGEILFFAPTQPNVKIKMPFNEIWFKCVKIVTSYAAVAEDIERAIELIKKKKINVKDMITHRLPLNKTALGFKIVSDAKESMKVIIEPNK